MLFLKIKKEGKTFWWSQILNINNASSKLKILKLSLLWLKIKTFIFTAKLSKCSNLITKTRIRLFLKTRKSPTMMLKWMEASRVLKRELKIKFLKSRLNSESEEAWFDHKILKVLRHGLYPFYSILKPVQNIILERKEK